MRDDDHDTEDTSCRTPEPDRALSRREFVKVLAAATAGTGLFAAAFRGCLLTQSQREEAIEALAGSMGKLPKRLHGTRTGKMMITPLAICQDWAPDLYGPGLDAGINFVHKAGYWKRLPEAFRKVPRESYYTDITVDTTPRNPDDEDGAYREVTAALERTGLRYFDIMRAHFGWRSVADMRGKRGTYRAFQRLKREGKVRYFGVTQHPFVPYPEIIDAMIEDGLVDSIQLFYAYGSPADVRAVLDKAHKAGIGLIAMKVYANGADKMRANPARMAALKAPGQVGRAAYRHVLTEKASDGKPLITAAVSSIQTFDQFEENVGAMSEKTAAADAFDLIG